MIGLILDHIWQSTLFAAAVGLITFYLKANSASVRYRLWVLASLKFLFPLALLTAAGRAISQALTSPPAAPTMIKTLEGAAQPFSDVIVYSAATRTPWHWEPIFGTVWFVGFTLVSIIWAYQWLQLRKAVRSAVLSEIEAQLPVKISPSQLEPALVGILNPVLILPAGITDQLSNDELGAIVAHEVCHWQRRDNLTAALHMMVETIFWFYPLVWWLETKLVAERERACDEGVIATGRDPHVYAEGILKVCKSYVHSSLQCASGVSGANLKRRLEMIMDGKSAVRMNVLKKGLLATCAAAAIAAPLALGLLTSSRSIASDLAEAVAAPHPGTEAALRHQIESMEKGQADFGVMVPVLAQSARTQSERAQAYIQKWGAVKSITFRTNENGNDVYWVEFENQLTAWTIGPLQPDGKIGPTLFFGPMVKRVGNGPSPGLETAIRRELDGAFAGKPALEIMSPALQRATQQQWQMISADAKNLGVVQTITFEKINSRGWDVYHVTLAHGTETVQAAPLTDGKLSGLFHSDILMQGGQPSLGTEASLRRYIESIQRGQPNYDEMTPRLAQVVRDQLESAMASVRPLGALKSIAFKGKGSMNMDVYDVVFEKGRAEWSIAPLDADGKVVSRGFHIVE